MKILLALALSLGLSCSARSRIPELAPKDIDPSIAIISGSQRVGHACAVQEMGVLTAAHVVSNKDGGPEGFTWSQGLVSGVGYPVGKSPFSDLAALDLEPKTYTSYPLGHASIGSQVYWYEYDFRTASQILRSRLRYATILRVVAGHVLFSEAPTPGASGTCLFSAEDGGAVAVIVSGFYTQDEKVTGMAIVLKRELEGE